MLLHARQRHMELLGKLRDRSVSASELLQNASSGSVRQRAERCIEPGSQMLNHTVQCVAHGLAGGKGRPSMTSLWDLIPTNAETPSLRRGLRGGLVAQGQLPVAYGRSGRVCLRTFLMKVLVQRPCVLSWFTISAMSRVFASALRVTQAFTSAAS